MRHSIAWPEKVDALLLHRERRAGGDAELLHHDVDAGDRLGDRVLHLQPRVHLDEIELAVLVEELDRAGAGIAEIGDGVGDGLADPRALRVVQRRRRRLLPDLLVAALQRAVALAEMHGPALAVAEHLHLDMARAREIFLQIDGVVAEGFSGFGARHRHRALKIGDALRHLHAAPAAAGDRLDQHRIADVGGDPRRLLLVSGRRRASPARPECRGSPPSPWRGSCRPSCGCGRRRGR